MRSTPHRPQALVTVEALDDEEPAPASYGQPSGTRAVTLARRALRLRRQGDLRKSANAYGELTSEAPSHSCWWVQLAATLAACGRVDEARKHLRQALYLVRRAEGEHAPRAHAIRLLDERIERGDFSLRPARARKTSRRRAWARAA